MKKTILLAAAVFAIAGAAEARKLSMMEWVDPQSMEIWQSLSEQDKVDSVKAYLDQQGGGGDKQVELQAKVKTCLDKEASDPDYKGTQIAMMIPMSYCMTKYTSIVNAQKK